MSRSGYSDDCDYLPLYRGQVANAIRGKRGQSMLRDLRDALEAMPVKRLIADTLEADGEVCALGALGRTRGIDMSKIDADDSDEVAGVFNVARQLAAEVVYMNDEAGCWRGSETPEERWQRMHKWVCDQIVEDPSNTGGGR